MEWPAAAARDEAAPAAEPVQAAPQRRSVAEEPMQSVLRRLDSMEGAVVKLDDLERRWSTPRRSEASLEATAELAASRQEAASVPTALAGQEGDPAPMAAVIRRLG